MSKHPELVTASDVLAAYKVAQTVAPVLYGGDDETEAAWRHAYLLHATWDPSLAAPTWRYESPMDFDHTCLGGCPCGHPQLKEAAVSSPDNPHRYQEQETS